MSRKLIINILFTQLLVLSSCSMSTTCKVNNYHQSNSTRSVHLCSKSKEFEPSSDSFSRSDPNQLSKSMNIPQKVWQRALDTPKQPVYFKTKSDVYISHKLTERLILSQRLLEHIPTAQRLYQYLYWTLRMNKVAHSMIVMVDQNGQKVLLFDIELHDQRGQRLYALCIANDVMTDSRATQPSPWKLVDLHSGHELTSLLGINSHSLPRGVRALSHQFEDYRKSVNLQELKKQILTMHSREHVNSRRYTHLKCIRTKHSRNGTKSKSSCHQKTRSIAVSVFHDAVWRSLNDNKLKLIPILSIAPKSDRDHHRKIEDFRFCPYPYVDYVSYSFCNHLNVIRFYINCLLLSISSCSVSW